MASVLFLTATDKERLKIKPLLARHSILEELAVRGVLSRWVILTWRRRAILPWS